MTVAALFVETGGVYFGLEGVEAYDEKRDAMKYVGPHPAVLHPPCERWGRYWSGGPSAKVRRTKGDDGGRFERALLLLCQFGGALEHPEASHAWAAFGLKRPNPKGGWSIAGVVLGRTLWTCQVEQGHYGHRARKKTWLLTTATNRPELIWGPSTGIRLDEGFHSRAERAAARAAGIKPRPRLSTRENLATPPAFRDVLLSIARSCLND